MLCLNFKAGDGYNYKVIQIWTGFIFTSEVGRLQLFRLNERLLGWMIGHGITHNDNNNSYTMTIVTQLFIPKTPPLKNYYPAAVCNKPIKQE